jgi:hypothetical protein
MFVHRIEPVNDVIDTVSPFPILCGYALRFHDRMDCGIVKLLVYKRRIFPQHSDKQTKNMRRETLNFQN